MINIVIRQQEVKQMMINENADNYDRETSEYIVAYLDLLGVTTRMKNNIYAQKIAMNKLHNLYNFNMNVTREIAIDGYQDIQFKIFSDNIIIAKKLSIDLKTRVQDIKSLLNCVSNFQCSAVTDDVGWLVRGGISIGDFYIDETMVWGQALLKSYEHENNIAIYPRIIIDSNIISELQKSEELTGYISQDFDNMYFLNYLYIQHFGGRFLKNGFKLMLDELKGTYSERVYQKLCWHMNYINRELDKKNERGESKYRLSID